MEYTNVTTSSFKSSVKPLLAKIHIPSYRVRFYFPSFDTASKNDRIGEIYFSSRNTHIKKIITYLSFLLVV